MADFVQQDRTGAPWDRDARPSLAEVVEVRRERQAMVGSVMAGLTDEQLATEVTCAENGLAGGVHLPVRECLGIVLNEGWEHRLFAERDLTALEPRRR